MEVKRLALQLKADTPGAVSAVFSTLNIIDKDQDVTQTGAFENGAAVNIAAWGHNWGDLPTGDGKIQEVGSEAIFDGAFYLGTPQGDAVHETLKQRLARGIVVQEWSYSYDVLEASFGQFEGQDVRFLKKLKVFEVSPVMVGAGEGTRTLGIKGLQFADQIETVQAAFLDLVKRSRELASLRAKEGRVMSAANHARLSDLHQSITGACAEMGKMLAEMDPGKASRDANRLFLEFVRDNLDLIHA